MLRCLKIGQKHFELSQTLTAHFEEKTIQSKSFQQQGFLFLQIQIFLHLIRASKKSVKKINMYLIEKVNQSQEKELYHFNF